MKLAMKIVKARKEFYAKPLKGTGNNKYAGYTYLQLEDFIPYCSELCEKYGFFPLISFNNEYAVMTVYDTDSDESFIITSPRSTANLKGCHEVQNLGAEETYQRRYLYNCLFEISEHDALDETTGMNEDNVTVQEKPKSSFNYKQAWMNILSDLGYSKSKSKEENDVSVANAKKFLTSYGIDHYEKITEEIYKKMCDEIGSFITFISSQNGPENFKDDNL